MIPKKIKTITVNEFNNLNFKDKLKRVLSFGEIIDEEITSVGDALICTLYKVNRFYVEIIYGALGAQVKEINSYKSGNTVQHFLPEA